MKEDKLGMLSLQLADLCQKIAFELTKKKEYNYSDQIKRSSCSICANLAEASHPQSKSDMISKLEIALKEAFELDRWFKMLLNANLIMSDQFEIVNNVAIKIRVLLIASIKTLKQQSVYG